MELTRDNYYEPGADMAFMSCSQYQAFCSCEARTMAKMEGRWIDEEREAFLVGNYFHTAFESPEAHAQFVAEHEDIIFKKAKKDGTREKYAPYIQADKMIQTAHSDPLIKSLIDLPGENEKILTGELFGIPWRVRLDKYDAAGRLIIDWKTCANIQELKWSDKLHEKVTFIDAYGYMMRAAVYTEIEKQNAGSAEDASFIIVAISKQDYPDKDVFLLNHRQRYDYELEAIRERIHTFQAIKEGRTKPRRCGYCDYCRATKQLYEIKPYYVLMPEFREGRAEELETDGKSPVLEDTQQTAGLG